VKGAPGLWGPRSLKGVNRWSIPEAENRFFAILLATILGRIMRLGHQPVNLTAQFYGNAVNPAGSSSWGMRLQIQFLYPKKPKK
jgi:hypothetical protein